MARITHNTWDETTNPRWAGDYYERDSIMPGGFKLVAASFPNIGEVTVTMAAAAAVAATSLTVDALSGPIPAGTILDFTGAGEFALTTADAAEGATTIAVEALDAAIEDNDTAVYAGTEARRYVQSGTLVGRTFVERAAGTGFGPWAASDDEVYLVLHDVYDAAEDNDVDLYRNGRVVKENYLPNFADLSAGALTALRAAYATTRGAQ